MKAASAAAAATAAAAARQSGRSSSNSSSTSSSPNPNANYCGFSTAIFTPPATFAIEDHEGCILRNQIWQNLTNCAAVRPVTALQTTWSTLIFPWQGTNPQHSCGFVLPARAENTERLLMLTSWLRPCRAPAYGGLHRQRLTQSTACCVSVEPTYCPLRPGWAS